MASGWFRGPDAAPLGLGGRKTAPVSMASHQGLRPWLIRSGPGGPGACRTLNDQPSTINCREPANLRTLKQTFKRFDSELRLR